ncbi:TPA_asm: RNA-directed RNA polymerase [ssRNA phage SRR6960802_2]|uniref:RNA-directed RNA polymerase n=1 Tax=ssRNA phage SRR6960802_2 TaxID=2786608 RepID=A0A8S5L5G8_9VIRU|nr:RNA-directed RNA polymerase [ssRNA phage SRR6960802_2]DAD52631.1 TPA_asm: RNA-directed RNA polymerase [ssRNA phage SRR6960802_2]
MSSKCRPSVPKKASRRISPNYLSRSDSDNFIKAAINAFLLTSHPEATDFGQIRLRYLEDNVWSKYSDPLPGKEFNDPETRSRLAIEKWQGAEERNAKTNSRLSESSVDFGRFTSERLFKVARGFVNKVLGTSPQRFIEGEFTGGASTRVKRSELAIAQKFEGKPHASSLAIPYWTGLALRYPMWHRVNPEVWEPTEQNYSVMFTVPKNSDIDRVACKEPEINMFLQRGLGLRIRTRLRTVGIDLQDQTRNQSLARNGRKRGLATLDLSSASDTISREIVRILVPNDWYVALDDLRVKEVEIPGKTVRHRLEMFSSMGNGFTFELESLIFWALTRAVAYLIGARGAISVFGDDIVCPIPVAKMLRRVFAFCGFSVNAKKSCISGEYRESCGAHFYGVQSVAPFFIRSRPREITDLIQIGNQLAKWMIGEEYLPDIPPSLFLLWVQIADRVPEKFWGGTSFERIDALVTGHMPRKRFHRLMEPSDAPMQGAYLQWHYDKCGRRLVDVCSPTETAREGRWVVRPNRSWYDEEHNYLMNRLIAHFVGSIDEPANDLVSA